MITIIQINTDDDDDEGSRELEIRWQAKTIQTTALLRSARILRRLVTQTPVKDPSANAGVKKSKKEKNDNNNCKNQRKQKERQVLRPC